MQFRRIVAPCVLAVFLVSHAQADLMDFSFMGSFSADDDVQLFDFSLGAPSTVTLKTLSYAGGTNSDGVVIPAGGFDPILAVFDSSLNFIADKDDGSFPDVGIDPVTFLELDTFLEVLLPAGNYTVAVSQFDNFFNGFVGDNITNGFIRAGEPNFTFTDGFGPAPMFNDLAGDARTSNWAFDILNVDSASIPGAVVPEPSSIAIWSVLGLVGCGVLRRRRNNIR